MKLILTALQEVYGLFVDDGWYAVAILVWVAASALLLPRLPVPREWLAPAVFLGLCALLIVEVGRVARR